MRIVCNLKEKREITNNLEIQIIRHACTQGQLHAEPSWLEMTWDFSEAIDFFFFLQPRRPLGTNCTSRENRLHKQGSETTYTCGGGVCHGANPKQQRGKSGIPRQKILKLLFIALNFRLA